MRGDDGGGEAASADLLGVVGPGEDGDAVGVADAVLAGNIMTGILSMPANCGQFAAGVVIASILAAALYKTPARKYFTYRLDEVK